MACVEEPPEKHCWVCFATEREDRVAEWVSPCRCKGCTKWIHQACLQRWLDEKQKGNSGGAVSCPQCGTEYNPLFLLMGLPTIPVMLVLGKMIRWEDYILRLWQRHSSKLQLLVPGVGRPLPRVPADGSNGGDHLSVSRTLCGALIFPSVANLVGRLIFRRVPSSLQRTVLGGIAFVVMKGVLKVYFKQQQYLTQANRHILNYPERERDMDGEGRSEGGEDDTEDSGNE
uniref:E3 ubiquitin-protein ligase MARCHF5 n=1 Tax=Oncorhynchus kisutch TaxID=8019 RepID=A0A8C7K0W3_ONCKI